MKTMTRFAAFAASATAAVLLVSCSAQGGAQDAGGEDAADLDLTIALVTHAAPGDTFWDVVRRGAEDAAAKSGIDLVYANDPDGSKQAQLVQQYTEQGVDGIAVSLAKPEALADSVTAAVDAGIPVVSLNSGSEVWKDLGILAHFGQDEEVAGGAVGESLLEAGLEHPICVIHEQGNVALEARCAGVKAQLPATEILYVTGTDNSAISSTVTAKLQSTPDADVIVGLGAPVTVNILDAVESSGSAVQVASFDLNAELAEAIADGKLLLTVDQQPYLQGYEAVDALVLNNTGGFVIGGGLATLTGPAIVDADNVEAIIGFAAEGIR